MKKINSEVLKDVFVVEVDKFHDNRGFFTETFRKEWFTNEWIQENTSFSKNINTVRGLHFQKGQYAQAKLVTVLKGSILDVIVDLRKDSPTYLKHEGFILTNENMKQLYVPRGFAHGFITLEDNVVVNYKVDNVYNKESERSINYADRDLNINWNVTKEVTISDKDNNALSLKEWINEDK